MLSLFPDLLFLAPLATTIVRVAAGIAYLFVGYRVFTNAPATTQAEFPIIGKPPYWLLVIAAAGSGAVGCLLFVGMWTQGAAIVASLGALKMVILRKNYAPHIPLPREASLLLLAISLSLLFSGAGAFAIDWPL